MLAQFAFTDPARLIALLLVPAAVWIGLAGAIQLSSSRRLALIAARTLAVALLCVAWAGPVWNGQTGRRFTVFLCDVSDSVSSAAQEKMKERLVDAAHDRAEYGTIVVAADVGLVDKSADFAASRRATGATDLAAGLLVAQASVPVGYVPQIVLLSDGRETRGNVLAAAAGCPVPVSTVPINPFHAPEVALTRLEAPNVAGAGETAVLKVSVFSNRAAPASLQLFQNDKLMPEKTIELPGRVGFIQRRFEVVVDDPVTVFRAVVQADQDAFPQNNSLSAVVMSAGPTRVLLVSNRAPAASHLKQTLQQTGAVVDLVEPNRTPARADQFAPYDVVILSAVVPSSLETTQTTALTRYVEDLGGGLIAMGGAEVFGVEAYQLTALEQLLPVDAVEQPAQQHKSLAMVLVVDKSLSMETGGRLQLAKVAAKRVVDVLDERDQVGVLAFGDQSQWISELAPLSDKTRVARQIDALTASGLTNMYPALVRAYLAISQADADNRHMIVLTDGVPTPGDYAELAALLAQSEISVSTIAVSDGADESILKQISKIAQGNHHRVDDPSQLPRILERETRSAVSKVHQEFAVESYRRLPGLLVASPPPLSDYSSTAAKQDSEVLLVAGEGDPLLSWRRAGRGISLAVTADVVDAWQNAGGDWNEVFWSRLIQHTRREPPAPGGRLTIMPTLDGLRAEFNVDPKTDQSGASAQLTVQRVDAQAKTSYARREELPMRPAGAGRYEASFSAHLGELLLVEADLCRDGDQIYHEVRPFAVAYHEEYVPCETDSQLLNAVADLTGGEYAPSAGTAKTDGRTVAFQTPLWRWLLVAVLFVFLGDMALRRCGAKDN